MTTGPVPSFLENGLSENDLNSLLGALYPIRVKYEEFGMQIGVHYRDIDAIAHDTDGDSGKKLLEVLKFRLRQSPALTWGDIDKALRSNVFNEQCLANSILEQCRVRSEERSSLQKEDDSSSSSSSDESSFNYDDAFLSETENKGLRKMFKKFFGRLCCDIKNPADIAAELQAKGLIKHSLMKELLLSPESDQAKTIKLVENIQKQIKQHPFCVYKMIELLLQREALQELGTEMKISAGKICPEKTSAYFNESRSSHREQSVVVGGEKMAEDSSDESRYSLPVSVSPLEMTPALYIFKKYLQLVYQARECHPVDKYLPTLESPYINLAMISRETRYQEERDEFTRQTLHGGVDQILQHKVPISIEDLLTECQVPWHGSSHVDAVSSRDTNYCRVEIDKGGRGEGLKHRTPTDVEDFVVMKRAKYFKLTGEDSEGPEHESLHDDVIEDMLVEAHTESITMVTRGNSEDPNHDSKSLHADITGDSKGKDNEKLIKFVLVEGPPGIGKSTFTQELCRRWEEIDSLRQFLIILLLKLREKWVLNATSLADLFRYEHDPELSKIIAREISDPNIQRRILLVLDGFDEVSHSFHEDSVVKRILRRELLPECTIILTTRPSARATLERVCQPQIDKHVEIIGFTEEERVRFIIEVFSKEPELQVNFLKYMFHIPHIKSMMYIPLNCAIIAQVYYESQSGHDLAIPKTRTQLYKELTHLYLVRHVETTESSGECIGILPECLNEKSMEKFKVLSKFAFDSYHIDMDSMSKKVTFFKEDIPEGFVHFGLMNESTEMYAGKGAEKTLSFLHLSLQEYLAAWYLAHNCSIDFQVAYSKLALCNDTRQVKYEGSSLGEKALIAFLRPFGYSLIEPAVFLAGITGWGKDGKSWSNASGRQS